MKLRFHTMTPHFARRVAAPTALQAAARTSCQPQSTPAPAAAEDQRYQVTPTPRNRFHWTIALAGVAVLVAGTLAAKRINFYHPAAAASYNTRLAELDTKLSHALASQLRAAGYEFDVAIVSVEPPACRQAVCLVKGLGRQYPTESFPGAISVQHVGNGTWSFAGMGELAALRFSVEAAGEMQRLAESTPPQFPQAALFATPIQSQGRAASPFNREYEILLSASTQVVPEQWLDLETGRRLAVPDWEYFSERLTFMHWLRTNALDLSADSGVHWGYCLVTRRLVLAPVERKLWEQASPQDIVSHPTLGAIGQFHDEPVSPEQDRTDTYLFRTEQGTFGILRVLEFNPASRQLRIQYKLAHRGANADA